MSERHWILVEDEPDLYDIMVAIFESFGVDCHAHTTGEDAIDWLDGVDAGVLKIGEPELAMIDLRLPGEKSGVEVAQRLRTSDGLRSITIVLMTAYHLTRREEQRIIREAGADLLLRKPLPASRELRKVLEGAIDTRRRRTARESRNS
jgi:CheY-like chemotaxis protein